MPREKGKKGKKTLSSVTAPVTGGGFGWTRRRASTRSCTYVNMDVQNTRFGRPDHKKEGVHSVRGIAALAPETKIERLAASTLEDLRIQADLQVRSR